jgi:hypothetical protein
LVFGGYDGNDPTSNVQSDHFSGPTHLQSTKPYTQDGEMKDKEPEDSGMMGGEPQNGELKESELRDKEHKDELEPQDVEEQNSGPSKARGRRRRAESVSSYYKSTDSEGSQPPKGQSGLRTLKPKLRTTRRSRNAARKTNLYEAAQRVPDLPTPAIDKEIQKKSNRPIQVVREGKVVEVGVKAALYRSLSSSPPLEYEFKALKGTVSL